MILARVRGAALGGLAVLLLSGAGIAFAGGPTPAPAKVAAGPSTNLAVVSAPINASGSTAVSGADVQQGDQATPDTGAAAVEQAGAEAPESATEPAETAAESATSAAEAASTEADGPGGHQDAAGQNVDHQFQGEE